MAECGYPSVYVVDSHATRPPVPPRLRQKRERGSVAQTLLFLLVTLALCGMTIEACLIYGLHQQQSTDSAVSPEQGDSAMSSQLIAGKAVTSTKRPSLVISPSKPVAHLTDGQDVVHGNEIMAWSMVAEPLLFKMDYKEKSLIIKREGYYYVYSKVFFIDIDIFHHSVHVKTKRYTGNSITLMESRKYSEGSRKTRSNSYLGGVFHLNKDDALFVKVNNTSKLVRHRSYENFFGAYMI